MKFKIISIFAITALLLTSCGGNKEATPNTTKPSPTALTLEEQEKALNDLSQGKKTDAVVTPTLFLDLAKDSMPAQATANKSFMFVLTIRSVEAGILSYSNNKSVSINVNALSYGSIAYKFPAAGEYQVVYTTEAGAKTTIAVINAI